MPANLEIPLDLPEVRIEIGELKILGLSATAAIKRWMKQVRDSGLSCFDAFLVTLENWLDEITNYVD